MLYSFGYIFNLNLKTEHLLPSPFKTDCMNYEKNIEKTNEYKSFHECEQKCKNKISLSLNKSENLKQIDCHCAKDCKNEICYFDLLASSLEEFSLKIFITIERDK